MNSEILCCVHIVVVHFVVYIFFWYCWNPLIATRSDSPLANLYSTSFMEYHHFNHFLTISQVEGNNIFKSLNEKEYADFLDLTKTTILATDLALYFKYG